MATTVNRMRAELRIFVYGTLKRGFSNHQRYCHGLLHAEPAYLVGKLFKLTARIPVLTIPDKHILAFGSGDIDTDLQQQEKMESFLRLGSSSAEERASMASIPGDPWRKVQGELLFFDDPEIRLPSMDFLEDFRPGFPSTYNRVLVSVVLPDGSKTAAWTYIAGFDTRDLEEYDGEVWLPD
jgi:gamma-glutamylcyclotransferase (GGCT)/AIG2-like uncharacterized protein YtfP